MTIMIDDIKKEAADRMAKSVDSLKQELTKLRTGRAHASLLDHITVSYYGSEVPLGQVASVGVSDARTLLVTPWEKNMVGPIEKAILKSDLGLNPASAGTVIRVPLPALTEERRRDLVKQAKAKGEDAKVSVRNIRRRAMEELHRIKKDGEAGEDEVGRAEKELDKSTAQYVAQIDELVKHKEGELLEV